MKSMILSMKYKNIFNFRLSQQDLGITQQNSKIHISTTYFWADKESQILSLHI